MSEEISPHTAARPTVFLVEEDDDVRPLLTRGLRSRGYRLLVAALLEDAREWAGVETPIHADLVLVNLVGKNIEEALILGRDLCDHAKYDERTPLVVVPEKVPQELEGLDVNVSGADWVCYYEEDSDQLQALLARLLKKSAR
jgi:DNA-binding response OmpR family regulator